MTASPKTHLSPRVIPTAVLYPKSTKLDFSPSSAAYILKTSIANAVTYKFLTVTDYVGSTSTIVQ